MSYQYGSETCILNGYISNLWFHYDKAGERVAITAYVEDGTEFFLGEDPGFGMDDNGYYNGPATFVTPESEQSLLSAANQGS